MKRNRPQHEILEELVAGIRGLDIRVRESLEDAPPFRRRRKRMHPMMIRELQHILELRRDDPITILIISSFFKDDLPWLYELGSEAYRAASNGNSKLRKQAYHRFFSAIRMLRTGPFLEEMGGDKMTYMMVRDLEHFFDRQMHIGSESDSSDTEENEERSAS